MNNKIDIVLSSLNNEQLKVVNNLDKELIVPAGAGSGKTKTLVSKLIYLLLQGHDLDSFLVLTFTKKAAAEMKERIKLELTNLGMFELVNKVDSANISTFDAYSYNIVKQNAHLLKLNSNLDLLDDAIFSITKRQIMDEIILKMMASGEEVEFLRSFTYNLSSDNFIKLLIEIYQKLKSKFKTLGNVSKDDLKPYDKDFIDVDGIKDFISEFSDDFYQNNIDKIESVLSYANYLNSNINGDFSSINKTYSWPKGLEKFELASFKKTINDLLTPIISAYKNNFTYENKVDLYQELDNYKDVLLNILKIFDQKITAFKERTNKYEFDDFANYLNELLSNHIDLKNRIKDKLKFVFIDEYQDTSLLQTTFLNHLIIDNKNIHVMYVGDIKQSIYKFRNAVPKSFIEKQKSVTNVSLSYNYRSYHEIINFVNKFFSTVLTNEEKHDIIYAKGHEMIPKHNEDLNKFSGVYALKLSDGDDDKKHYAHEAFAIGHEILKLKRENKISDFSEVTILSRNKKDFKVVSDVFKYLEIPIQIQIDVNINEDYLLKLLSNILMFSLNINDINENNIKNMRFMYLSIARSPLFNYKEGEIFKSLIDEDVIGKINTHLKISDEISNKAKLLYEHIKYYSNTQIIDALLSIFDVYNNISKTFNLEMKQHQIKFIYELANTLTDLDILSADFVIYLYNLAYDDNLSFKQSVLYDDADDSVKITNIHQSKGLEYDVLFLMNLDSKFGNIGAKIFNYSDETNLLLMPNFYNHENKKIKKELLKFHYKNRENLKYASDLKEELRLFYVATTRAKRALYLNVFDTEKYERLASYRDYLLNFNALDLIDENNIFDYSKLEIDSNYYDELNLENEYYDSRIDDLLPHDFNFSADTKESLRASINTKELIDDQLKLSLAYGNILHLEFEYADFYDLANLTGNPLKFSKHSFHDKRLNQAKEFLSEYQFVVKTDQATLNGIIDLLVIYEDAIHIIDYKTSDINNPGYLTQLETYKNYLATVFNKKIHAFLYSIKKDELKKII